MAKEATSIQVEPWDFWVWGGELDTSSEEEGEGESGVRVVRRRSPRLLAMTAGEAEPAGPMKGAGEDVAHVGTGGSGVLLPRA